MTVPHRERMQAVLAGQKPDRTPVALWRHFPVDDQEPQLLADLVSPTLGNKVLESTHEDFDRR
jgi:hypothetical protein